MMKFENCSIGTPVIMWYGPNGTKIPILTNIIKAAFVDSYGFSICAVEGLPGYVETELLEEITPETLARAKRKGLFDNFNHMPKNCKVLFEYEIDHMDVLSFCMMYRAYRKALEAHKNSSILSDIWDGELEQIAIDSEVELDIEVQQWLQKNEDKIFYEVYPEALEKQQYYFDVVKALNGSNKLHLALRALAFKYNGRLFDDLEALKVELENAITKANYDYPTCTPERFLYVSPTDFYECPQFELGQVIEIIMKPVRKEVNHGY